MANRETEKLKTRNSKNPESDMLVKGEDVIHAGRVHWGIFVVPGIYVVAGLLVGAFFHWLIGGIILFMSIYPVANTVILYITTRLVLTNKRVYARYGFFEKDHMQIRIERIESAHLEQPLLGQILGYSTVVVRGTGTGSIPVPYIANGKRFVRKLEEFTLGDKESDETEESRKSDDEQVG